MTANPAASIRARLKQHTDTSKQDFNLTLTRYGLERLLYRLSISEPRGSSLDDGRDGVTGSSVRAQVLGRKAAEQLTVSS